MKRGIVFFTILLVVVFSSTFLAAKERLTVPCEWCNKIDMRDVMMKMKAATNVLTAELQARDWDAVANATEKLTGLYNNLPLGETEVPDDYWEFHEDFQRYMGRFVKASEERDEKDADYQFKRVKTACHHCHIRYVRRKKPDKGIALERLYKDQFMEYRDKP